MQIIETNLLRVIVPDKGYKLVNKLNNKTFNKVYLGINDSPDNYIEVIDEDYVDMKYVVEIDEMKSAVDLNQEYNDENLNLVLLSIAQIYEIFEPLLAMVPMTLNEVKNGEDPLTNMYLFMVQRGLIDIEDVPNKFKENVKQLL